MRVPVSVDRRLPLSLQRQIYDAWRRGILDGRFRRGDQVPSTRELASALAVSRATVTAAYDQLIAEGYFEGVHGSGTFICRELPEEPLRPDITARVARAAAPVRLSRHASRLRDWPARPPLLPGMVDLARTGPDIDYFPFTLWRRLLMRHLRRVRPRVVTHSAPAAGHEGLRQEIAAYVARSRAVRCDPGQVIVVNGSQQALDLCMRVLVDEGDAVAVEDPAYPGTRHLCTAYGARIVPIAVTVDGLRVAGLPETARIVCVTPSHQFPSGVSMSLARRLELLDWARTHSAVVIEDDYDSEYRYSGAPLPALQGLGRGASVIYVGTYSNVMFPGLRLGYVIVPRDLVRPFTRAKSLADRATPMLEQAALADFKREGHLERHIRRMRRLYRRRREALLEEMARHFGDSATVQGDAAGMHALVKFEARDIAARAARQGVRLISAAPYYASGRAPGEFIISFAATPERTLAEGIRRLAK